MKKASFIFIFLCCIHLSNAQKLLSPKEFLGYELGDRFTPHHRVMAYFKHVAEVMPNVDLRQYGETYEHRPLVYAVVTSVENFKDLEQIRTNNLRRSGLMEGTATADPRVLVWLSYNVHGNEASSLEASMLTLFDLANANNTKTQEWLKNTVVILDPCINPDGRDRYANFYNQYLNNPPNSDKDAKEHHEPWPGGRANHYLFDLNRDWAWGTQIETQQRLKVYNEWMPHVHVDFHEQSYNSPYYFAPAAEPYHEVISPWQREFQNIIGKNNAKYFDEQGWLYFTKEFFDLFYPSYGDTYPMYSGAIGMTYEQGGGGSGGLSITTKEGDPLTLKDRLTHHYTSGLATIEVTSGNAGRVIKEFEQYFKDNLSNPRTPYKAYVIKADNNPDKLTQLTRWMDLHLIKYGQPTAGKSLRGFDYQNQATSNFSLTTDDLVINVYQPKSRFITTVFEPQSKLADSVTYDITAWNLMYAYNLKAYAVNERIPVKNFQAKDLLHAASVDKPYAYIFKYQSLQDVAFMAELMKLGIKVRAAEKSFSINGDSFEPGSLIITRRNNENVNEFDKSIRDLAKGMNRKVFTSPTGFASKGKDVGAEDVKYLKAPKVAMLFGEETSSLSAGEVWHFFETQIKYPITQIGTDYFEEIELSKYDVLIVPEGRYKVIDESQLERIANWVSKGGKLIIIANGLNAFAEKKGFNLKKYITEVEKNEAERKEKLAKEKELLTRYADAERKEISNVISGAIYKISLDTSHPLAFGVGDTYYTLKTNELRFAYLEAGWNVGVIKGIAKPVQGFAGKHINKKMDDSLVFGVEEKGDGTIIYLVDNPLFRSFWENGKMIFSNAVFMAGQ
ncbi:M14 family metallopeptidase [Chryseolinea sp. H1M3-3]|uniref:M14 family metallopeptidase n=1 Tax=Chryseolinea sp. H1M3-3 TaxID=3034144 RepID=UPI0023EB423A|nr:M14 family metallopeptidase [Chryseolinea sp. H1M3-3]